MESSIARESLERIAGIAGTINDESLETICVSILAGCMFRNIPISFVDGSDDALKDDYCKDRIEDNSKSAQFVARFAREVYHNIRDGA